MGRASSAKKVARAARAGGGGKTRATRERSILFPSAVAIVCVLGLALVIYARATLDDDAAANPTLSDHWHGAIGIYVCGEFQPDFQSQEDPDGIHSHQDGIIHIHPFSNRVTGTDARFSVFLDAMDASVTDDEIVLDGETSFVEGEDQCDGEDAEVQLAVWANADEAADTDPIIITEDIADENFENDRFAWTLAFVPSGEDIPPPESIPGLDNLTDVIDPTDPTAGANQVDPSTDTGEQPTATTVATTTP